MKKSFFKKLSFILALAMIVSLVAPAAGAFAASSPKLSSTKKYLFLGEESRNEYDFNIKNKVAGSKYAWSSADKNVAIVDKATGLTTAVAKGTTKVTVVISKKGKKDVKLSASVIVKDNIKTVTISNKPEKAVAVGAEYDFNRTYTTFGGNTTNTSAVTRWIVDKADKATIADNGVFKATEAGTYKVTALSFQSVEKYNAWKALNDPASTVNVLASNSVDVKVAATMTATQKDLDTVEVKFDSPMTDVDKNISFYAMVGTAEVRNNSVKSVKMSDDNKTATVDFYVNLSQGTDYVVKFTDLESVKFKSAVAKAENVASIAVKTKEAVVSKETDLEATLLDANGVDITTVELSTAVTFEVASKSLYYNSVSKKLVMYNKGESTEVTATYHSYKYDNTGEIGNLTAKGVIACVDAPSTVVGSVNAWTIVDTAKVAGPNYNEVYQKIAAEDSNRKLFVRLNTTTGTSTDTVDSSDVAQSGKFKYESSDASILYINNTGNVYAFKPGAVKVVVKLNDAPVATIDIQVSEKRSAKIMNLGKEDVTLSNSVSVLDTDAVTVQVVDLLGDEVALSNFTVTKLTGPASNIASVDLANKKVVFTGAGATKGDYQYKISANGLEKVIRVHVLVPTSDVASTYMLSLGTNSLREVDSKITTTNQRPVLTVDLFGIAGTKTTRPSITGSNFKVVVTDKDGKQTTLGTNSFDLTSVSGSALTKVAEGYYQIDAYEYQTVGNGMDWVNVAHEFFTVKDTQTKPVFVEVKSATFNSASPTTIAQTCLKVTMNGADVSGQITMDTTDYDGDLQGYIWVKSVKYTETIGGYTYTHKVTVNRGLNYK